MIEFNNISKFYANSSRPALNNVQFEMPVGSMAFLTGHSGAGKTTLMKLILRIEDPTRGQVMLAGKNINRLTRKNIPALRSQIGMIFQNPNLLENRTIFDNVAVPLIIAGFRPAEIKRRVFAALEKVGLLDKEKHFPQMLSTGEQQRIGIARAIVNRPPLLLADEPTGNLDPILSKEIFDLFESFNAVGTTVLVATHDLSLIAGMRHRILTLSNGELVGDSNE